MIRVVRSLVLAAGVFLFASPAVAQTATDSTQAVTVPPAATSGRQQLPATMQVQRQGSVAANNGGEPVRWGIVGGTFVGLTYGIVHVTHRAQPRAVLEFDGTRARLDPVPLAAIECDGAMRVHVLALHF